MDKRTPLGYVLLTLKGMAMGAADVVPGVSGGTIAFISGIYEELIDSINAINLSALNTLRKEGFKAFWNQINGTFFMFLFSGIAISIFSLARLLTYLLEQHPILLWSFFFGLIIASVWLVSKAVTKWSSSAIVSLVLGGAIAYYITTIQSTAEIQGQWFILFSGALAICAMILPGISGAFILLLLGSYDEVLTAIADRDLLVVGMFVAGCGIGLLSFARLLKLLFKQFHNITVALLTGFMIGSLNKVWPWKKTLMYRENSAGESVPFIQENILPNAVEGDNLLVYAIVCMIAGFLLISLLERFGPKEA